MKKSDIGHTHTWSAGFRPACKMSALLPLFIALFAGCSGKGEQAAPSNAAVPVRVAIVEQKDVPVQLRAVGTVEAYSMVEVKPQVSGILAEVHFKEGQDVRKEDLLFTIDPRPFEALVAQAKGNLAKDQVQARHALEEVRRYEDLVKKDFVTKEQFEQIRTNAEAFQAALQADQAALDTAGLQLAYCTIRSPVDGRTGSLKMHAGNVVKANEAELVSIHQIQPIYVRFAVPERDLPQVQEHMAAGHLKVEAIASDERLSGTLSFINNTVDRDTGTIQLKATFSNERGILWPGQFVDVLLTLTTAKNAVVVASEAVQTGQQGDYVFVVKSDSTVELRPVQVQSSGEKEAVIRKGLNAGDTVVTDGHLNLVPGARVEIKNSGQGKV